MSATTSMATHTTAPDSVPPLPANGPSGVGAKGLVPPPPDADFGARLTPTKQAAATPPAKRGSDLALLRQVSTKPTMSVSPFVGSWSKITGLNLARTIVLSPLGVVRLSASVLIVLACTFWCWLVLLGRQPEDQLGTVRRRLAVPVVQVGARLLLLTLGFWWIPVKGERDLGARVLVANHSTLVDVLVLLWQVGPSFLSKQSVLDAPLFGTICKALQVVGVDRVSNEDKGRSKALMTRLIQDRSGPPLLIFPEGTTTRCDTMIRFKPGAFALGAPVQPILLHWRYGLFDPANTALTPPLPWLLQMLTQVYQTVSLELLPAVHPDETEVGNPLMFAANVRAKMLAVLERRAPYPMYDCEQGVDDFLVWKRFVERKVPDPRAALHSLSLQGLRAAVSLATPAPRQAVSLAMLLACANRYMKLLRASGAAPARLASLDVLARWALGAHQTAGPSPAERAFESAFAHAMAFPTTADDSSIDLRAFAMGLIYLSALGAIWGGPGVPRFDSPDPGPRRWAELRARATFALLTAHGQAAEQVSGRFVGEFLGLPEQALLVFKDPEEDMYGAARFKDAVVIALVGQVVPEGADEAASSKIKEDNEAAYGLLQAAWAKMNANFAAKSGGMNLFLSDEELGWTAPKDSAAGAAA